MKLEPASALASATKHLLRAQLPLPVGAVGTMAMLALSDLAAWRSGDLAT
jgi:hypothetical protein